MKKKNVIILTGGLAGSSVLSALLSQVGYWTGQETKQKRDYNTWENSQLVELNKKILQDSRFKEDWVMEFRPDYVDLVLSGAEVLATAPYAAFARDCERHSPWLWKDPRLWLTIRYWERFLPTDDVFFLIIRREPLQAWISTTIRRQIQTIRHAKRYNSGIHDSILGFVRESNLPHLDILYEDLLLRPGEIIGDINHALDIQLSVEDWKQVFRGRLFRRQHGALNLLKAFLIYTKNYTKRHR